MVFPLLYQLLKTRSVSVPLARSSDTLGGTSRISAQAPTKVPSTVKPSDTRSRDVHLNQGVTEK